MRRAFFAVLTALGLLLLAGTLEGRARRGVRHAASASGGGSHNGLRLRAIVPSGPPPAIMPLSAVKPGMVGEALTVFQGTKPEPFKVRVVSVLRNFLPKQDVILMRAEDPRVEHSGIVAGMSGSPVYIDGKLVGAVAYAWSFAKEPLGGVTPIETMLAERTRPRRSGKEVLAEGWSAPDTSGKAVRASEGGGVPHASLTPAQRRADRAGARPRPAAGRADDRDRRAAPAARVGAALGLGLHGPHGRGAGRAARPRRAWCRCRRAAAASRVRRPPATSSRARRSASSWCAAT